MATSKQSINKWLAEGLAAKATHVLIVTDTWDYDDYPVQVIAPATVQDKLKYYANSQDRVMEVYNLSLNIENQLNQSRAWNL